MTKPSEIEGQRRGIEERPGSPVELREGIRTDRVGGQGKIAPRLLTVDDDEQILRQLRWALADDYEVFSARDRQEAIEILQREEILVVLLDLGLPPSPRDATEGLRALEEMLALNPLVKIVIVSGNPDRENAVRAVEKGAYDFFAKPLDLEGLRVVVERVFRRLELESESVPSSGTDEHSSPLPGVVGTSPALLEIAQTVRKVSTTDAPVLVSGETGTGKERIARAIHELSPRRSKPFVAINCGAIPETLIESELFGYEAGAFTGAAERRRGRVEFAHGGTLFLDEIGDLASDLQVKLLRFLQEKTIERVGGRETIPVECRVIAASHVDFQEAVQAGRFREDLFFRLAVVLVDLPPLRERLEDVVPLAEHFVDRFTVELDRPKRKLSKRAIEALRLHAWPGNIRELENRTHRAVLFAEGTSLSTADFGLEDVPEPARRETLREAKEKVEYELVSRVLRECRGNISKTARRLGVSRPTLYDLLERYDLKAK